MYKQLIKPILFKLTAEKAHHTVFSALKNIFKLPGAAVFARTIYKLQDERLKTTVFGLDFPNPVGLAAGLDKDAHLFNELSDLGFGFVEIGTLTPIGQPGNPQPRLFRLPIDEALINRMGFNNQGVKDAAKRLKNKKRNIIIGGNIGKNKVTSNEGAVNDYIQCFHTLFDYVDYFVVNVSSPNTPGLRDLQEREPLKKLLQTLQDLDSARPKRKPILLKIAPDLSDLQLDDIIEIVQETRIDGVIATNTTISREHLNTSQQNIEKMGNGGLSGKPLKQRSTEVIRYLHQKSGKAFPIIGVGGIHSAEDALEKLNAGASLVQIYTGFIYEGPVLIKNINKAILKRKKSHQ